MNTFIMSLIYLLSVFLLVNAKKLDFDLVTDYTVNDCLKNNNDQKQNYFALDSNGFPYCAKYDDSIICGPTDDTCAPGLKCNVVTSKCVVDTNSCFKYYANVNGNANINQLLWTPDCLEDGSWAPKQCKGGVAGRCFCYAGKGSRIFGDSFKENSANMTCACSRRKAELLDTSNGKIYATFHCDSQGNYEELQCDSNHCWCVEPQTGEPTSKIVPDVAMKYLKCGTKLQGSQYLRKCESVAYAQTKIIEEMKRHGTTSPNIQVIACGDDGSYGPYTIDLSEVYCVSRSNTKTTYQSPIANLKSIDCNCAHDQELYTRLGKVFTLICDSTGNYKPFQSIAEDDIVKNFCVDKDGNKKVDNVPSTEDDAYCNKFYD